MNVISVVFLQKISVEKAKDLVVVEISDHKPLQIRFTSGQKAIDYPVLLGLSNTEVKCLYLRMFVKCNISFGRTCS